MGTRALARLGLENALLSRLQSKRLQVCFQLGQAPPCVPRMFRRPPRDATKCLADAHLDDALQSLEPACTVFVVSDFLCFAAPRQTVGDVLLLSQLELVETLDLAPGEAAALLRAASRSVVSAPVTVRLATCRQRALAQGLYRAEKHIVLLAS